MLSTPYRGFMMKDILHNIAITIGILGIAIIIWGIILMFVRLVRLEILSLTILQNRYCPGL